MKNYRKIIHKMKIEIKIEYISESIVRVLNSLFLLDGKLRGIEL